MLLKDDYYDTHSAVEDLSSADMSERSAKAIVRYVTRYFNNWQHEQLAHLATKDDLAITKLELQKEMEEIRKEIVVASHKTILWIAGMLIVNTGLIVSLTKLL